MAEEKQLETLQEEVKLLKGELKQSLASVRDYLLNMELPSSEFSTILAALGSDGEQHVTMKGSLGVPPSNQPMEEPEDELTTTEEEVVDDEAEMPPEDEDLFDVEEPDEEDQPNPEKEDNVPSSKSELLPEDISEETTTENNFDDEPDDVNDDEENDHGDAIDDIDSASQPGYEQYKNPIPDAETEEPPMDYGQIPNDAISGIPKVNMLANLINWVARTKKDINTDQLPIFLEIYGLSGNLSPELKEVILHLSEVTESRSNGDSTAEIWSQAMLSLHGILTGGDVPQNPVMPSWSSANDEIEPPDETVETDKPEEKSVKLKLVLPNENGESQEFCIDLTPEVIQNTSLKTRKNSQPA